MVAIGEVSVVVMMAKLCDTRNNLSSKPHVGTLRFVLETSRPKPRLTPVADVTLKKNSLLSKRGGSSNGVLVGYSFLGKIKANTSSHCVYQFFCSDRKLLRFAVHLCQPKKKNSGFEVQSYSIV